MSEAASLLSLLLPLALISLKKLAKKLATAKPAGRYVFYNFWEKTKKHSDLKLVSRSFSHIQHTHSEDHETIKGL